jgi:hypothetical protein
MFFLNDNVALFILSVSESQVSATTNKYLTTLNQKYVVRFVKGTNIHNQVFNYLDYRKLIIQFLSHPNQVLQKPGF